MNSEVEVALSLSDKLTSWLETRVVVKVCVLVLRLETEVSHVCGIPVKDTLLNGAVLSSTGEAEKAVPEDVVEQLVVVVVVEVSVVVIVVSLATPRRSKKARSSGNTAMKAILGLYLREMLAVEVMV